MHTKPRPCPVSQRSLANCARPTALVKDILPPIIFGFSGDDSDVDDVTDDDWLLLTGGNRATNNHSLRKRRRSTDSQCVGDCSRATDCCRRFVQLLSTNERPARMHSILITSHGAAHRQTPASLASRRRRRVGCRLYSATRETFAAKCPELAATLRGSRPGVQSASLITLIMTSLMTS